MKRPRNYQTPDLGVVNMVRKEHPNICYDVADKGRVQWYNDHAAMFGYISAVVVAMACRVEYETGT